MVIDLVCERKSEIDYLVQHVQGIDMLGLAKDKVELCPYNDKWQNCFQDEKEILAREFNDFIVDICHFGSTAIPGIVAKPIIDIAVLVRHLEDVEKCKEGIIKLGYECHGQIVVEGCVFFSKGNPTTHHVHFTEENNINMKKWLFFRDRLREKTELAIEYQALKQKLEHEFANDRKSYNKGKDKFVQRVLLEMVE